MFQKEASIAKSKLVDQNPGRTKRTVEKQKNVIMEKFDVMNTKDYVEYVSLYVIK